MQVRRQGVPVDIVGEGLAALTQLRQLLLAELDDAVVVWL